MCAARNVGIKKKKRENRFQFIYEKNSALSNMEQCERKLLIHKLFAYKHQQCCHHSINYCKNLHQLKLQEKEGKECIESLP